MIFHVTFLSKQDIEEMDIEAKDEGHILKC